MTPEAVHARAVALADAPAGLPDWICAPVIPHGLDAEILVKPEGEGWTWSLRVRLPEAGREQVGSAATREGALVAAFEDLIGWCGEQKDTGGKRHRKQAEQLQDWALAQEKLVRTTEVVVAAEGPVAPATDQAAVPNTAQLVVEWLPIADVLESPWNPRQIFPEKEMQELTESMRAGGFRPWQPLVGRPVGPTSECWRPVLSEGRRLVELGAGHRRRRAAELAGLQLVPVVVREMSDEEFLKLLNFDNSGREDVHPLHEAAGWRMLMDRTGMGVADIAAHIGQGKGYVFQRLKYDALIGPAREAFLNQEISARHAILIARLEAKAQERALGYAARADWQGNKPSHRALARWLHEEENVDLRNAPFLGDRDLIPAAGSCDDCPKRGKNIQGFDHEDRQEDVCTDRACHAAKVDAHLVQIKKRLEAAGEVVLISGSWGGVKKGVLARGDYEEVEAGAKGAKRALVVDGTGTGQVVTVRVKQKQQQASPAAQREKLERENKDRQAKIERERKVRLAILAAVRPKVAGLTRADVEALLREILQNIEDADLLCEMHGIQCERQYMEAEALQQALPKLKEAELFQLCVEISVMEDLTRYNMDGRKEPALLVGLAKRYKVDAAKIRREVEEAGKADEGGTRKEVEVPAKKTPAKKTAAKKKAAPKKQAKAKGKK